MDNKIVLKTRGKITAQNADSIKEMFLEKINGTDHPHIVVDMSEVYFISSAGLRVMMELQKRASFIEVINLSPDVYEVFSVTGLTEVMHARRMYKEITIDGLQVLGRGATATVYRINDEQIVKVYNKDVTEEELLLEQAKTRKALLAGVPTMLSFETVRVGDQLGAIYEVFDFATLVSIYVDASDEERQNLTRKYAVTVRQLCGIEVEPEDFTDFKGITKERLEKIKDRIDEKTFAIFRNMIDQIPDEYRFVHGDCHMENLMLDQDENLVVIDLGISGYGNSVFALSGIAHYKVFIELITDEEAYKSKGGLSFAEGKELYHRFMMVFCEKLDEKRRELAEQGVYLYSCLFSALEYVGTPLVTDESLQFLSEKIVKAFDEGFDFAQLFESLRECI